MGIGIVYWSESCFALNVRKVTTQEGKEILPMLQ